MTIFQAYKRIKSLPRQNILVNCFNFEDKWGFIFIEDELEENDYIFGGVCKTVNKKSGKIGNIPLRPDKIEFFENSKQIDIKIFKDI